MGYAHDLFLIVAQYQVSHDAILMGERRGENFTVGMKLLWQSGFQIWQLAP
jgi:hypothetical protein